jgi:hypothetical protein
MVRAFGATRQQALQQQPACFAAATSAQKSVDKLWGHFAPEFSDAAL